MKNMIMTALLLVGMSAAAQPVCTVSEDLALRIDEMNNSSMMAKPKFNTIRSMIQSDECVDSYLQEGDDYMLARKITNFKTVPSQLVLNQFVADAHAKRATKSCQAAQETIDQVDMIRTSGMHVKAMYVSIKGTLSLDECLSSELNEGEIAELAQELGFDVFASQSTEDMINQALANK